MSHQCRKPSLPHKVPSATTTPPGKKGGEKGERRRRTKAIH